MQHGHRIFSGYRDFYRPIPREQTGTTAGGTTAARATVAGTIDGDTIRLAYPDGTRETLRILGIDTPEVTPEGNDPRKFEGVTDLSYLSLWGEEAAS